MKVNEYKLKYIPDLHRFEITKTQLDSSEYLDYYNAVVVGDDIKRLDTPCLLSFDTCVLYSNGNDGVKAEKDLVEFLKTYYRGRICSTTSALEVLESQYPNNEVVLED